MSNDWRQLLTKYGCVRLARTDLTSTRGRVEINSGTEPHHPTPAGAKQYLSGARVPRDDWRPMNDAEWDSFTVDLQNDSWWRDRTVHHIRMNDEAMSIVDSTDIRRVADAREFADVRARPGFNKHLEGAIRELDSFCIDADALKFLGVCLGAPDMASAATDTSMPGDPLCGLHIDCWDDRPMQVRHGSRNRICINISQETRWFMFGVVPLDAMLRAIPSGSGASTLGPTALASAFLSAYSDAPIIRFRLEPGEGYIAPTESVLHDGSTKGSRLPDATLNLLGHFGPIGFTDSRRDPIGYDAEEHA